MKIFGILFLLGLLSCKLGSGEHKPKSFINRELQPGVVLDFSLYPISNILLNTNSLSTLRENEI